MKIHRTADDFLQDIVDWGEWAERHVASLTREQFMSDEKSQDAVSNRISNVGEAANEALNEAARDVISPRLFALGAAVLRAMFKQSMPKCY